MKHVFQQTKAPEPTALEDFALQKFARAIDELDARQFRRPNKIFYCYNQHGTMELYTALRTDWSVVLPYETFVITRLTQTYPEITFIFKPRGVHA